MLKWKTSFENRLIERRDNFVDNALTLFFFFQIGGITMRRIDRRLVLLSFVLVCDVVSVFGRPQEHSTAGSQLKGINHRKKGKKILNVDNKRGWSLASRRRQV